MADSSIEIANQALIKLGEDRISSFAESEDVSTLYETVVTSLLSMRAWHFATKRVTLEADGAAPPGPASFGYLLPAQNTDRIGRPRAFYASTDPNARVIFNVTVLNRWAYTNETVLACTYTHRISESLWPGYFEKLVVEALAADLALPITENASRYELHYRTAYGTPGQGMRGGLFAMAESADDLYQDTPSLIDHDDEITAARFGGF